MNQVMEAEKNTFLSFVDERGCRQKYVIAPLEWYKRNQLVLIHRILYEDVPKDFFLYFLLVRFDFLKSFLGIHRLLNYVK